jgi:hypothetical protein
MNGWGAGSEFALSNPLPPGAESSAIGAAKQRPNGVYGFRLGQFVMGWD